METISAKIPEELREKIREYGIEVSKTIRRALESEVFAHEENKLKKRLEKISPSIRTKITKSDVVSAIRAGREGR